MSVWAAEAGVFVLCFSNCKALVASAPSWNVHKVCPEYFLLKNKPRLPTPGEPVYLGIHAANFKIMRH